MPPSIPTLYTLGPSHYCERARWALDAMGVRHRERRLAAGLHVPMTRRLAPLASLPVLDTGEGIVQGSDRILDWTGMGGGAPALEARLQDAAGPLVRQFVYAAALDDPRSGVRDMLLEGVPPVERAVARVAWPITRRLMASSMAARRALVPRIQARMEVELDWFDAALGERDHLVGDSFGRADVTAASLLAPLARPDAPPFYGRVRLPPEVEDVVARWAERPGIRWVRRTYARHRRA